MSLKLRQLSNAKATGRFVILRFRDNFTVEGKVIDVDANDVCILDGQDQRVFPLNEILEIRVTETNLSIHDKLITAKQQNLTITLSLSNGQSVENIQVLELDESSVLLRVTNRETVLDLESITEVIYYNSPANNTLPTPAALPSPNSINASVTSPSSFVPVTFPNLRNAAIFLEQQLASISWTSMKIPELITKCPVPNRWATYQNEAKIWARAISFAQGKNWAKAISDFEQFARLVPDKPDAYLNIGICFAYKPEFGLAALYFEQVIAKLQDTEVYLGAVTVALQAQYWHKATEWMLTYLTVCDGTDASAFQGVDFALKFGLYLQATNSLLNCLDMRYPPEQRWILSRIAFIVQKSSNLPDALSSLVESTLTSNQSDLSISRDILQRLQTVVKDQPTLEYRNAIELERNFKSNNPHLDINRVSKLREQIEEARKQYRFKEAKELLEELLQIIPTDEGAKRALTDVNMRLAPPQYQYRASPNRVSTGTRSKGSYYDQARRAMSDNRLDDAKELFKQAITNRESRWQGAVMDLAGIHLRLNEIDEGVNAILHTQRELDPNSSDNMLGALYFKGERYEEALEAYRRVRDRKEVRGEKVAPMISMAMSYVRLNQLDSARGLLAQVLKINPRQTAAKGLLEAIDSGTIGLNEVQVDVDAEGQLLIRRTVGSGTIGISKFLEDELANAAITGLDRYRIERQDFELSDVNYLLGTAGRLGSQKPEQIAPYFRSAAKVLDILGQRDDERFRESLRKFCTSIADYFAIKNYDVARVYYIESFKLEDRIDDRLKTKFIQLLMTILCSPDDFLQPKLSYTAPQLLERGLKSADTTKVLLVILLASRYNPDLVNKLNTYLREVSGLDRIFRERLANLVGEPLRPLPELIEIGHKQITECERLILEKFRYFLENSTNFQRIYNISQSLLEWEPNFVQAGIDFNGTDANRLEEMKRIIRQYISFYSETNFEAKDRLFSTILFRISELTEDIERFPTDLGRCSMLPILIAWQSSIEAHFSEVASVSQPNLQIIEVVKTLIVGHELEMHLLISNRLGKSAASGIKLLLFDSTDNKYVLTKRTFDVDRTLPSGEETTLVVRVEPTTTEPGFTLHYRVAYSNRAGEEVTSAPNTIAVRMDESEFHEIYNPYAAWASSDAVTDPLMFFGRDQLIEELINVYRNKQQRKVIVIYGQKRAGKSSILYHVKQRLDEDNQQGKYPPVIGCIFSLGRVSINPSLQSLFYELARELFKTLKDLIPKDTRTVSKPERQMFLDDPFGVFVEYSEDLLQSLRAAPGYEDAIPLLLLDEFTYIYAFVQQKRIDPNFMKAWKSLVERKLFSFLLAGIDEMPDFIESFPNEFAMAELKRVSYLEPEFARQLIERPIWDSSKEASRFQERAIVRIQELTGNSAYYIQIFNNVLVDYLNDQGTGFVTEADVDSVAEQLTSGKNLLSAANFDNLTRYQQRKESEDRISPRAYETEIEEKLLRVLAFLTKTEDYASLASILAKFPQADHEAVRRMINDFKNREVIKAKPGTEQFAFVVGLYKEWLNSNLPFEEVTS